MGTIYALAIHVYIWLGTMTPDVLTVLLISQKGQLNDDQRRMFNNYKHVLALDGMHNVY
jgi:hypothetical protein